MGVSVFFNGEISPKGEIKNQTFEKKEKKRRFSVTKSENLKKNKNHNIHIFGFHCVARQIEG